MPLNIVCTISGTGNLYGAHSDKLEIMKRIAVESSSIAEIGYDPLNGVLEIEFHSGSVYQYHEVPADVYGTFINADSLGRFFNQYIKDNYPTFRIRR